MKVTVVGLKGGVGKTTCAVHLGVGLARLAPTVVVDADPQGSAVAWAAMADGQVGVPVVGLAVANIQNHLPSVAGPYQHTVVDTPPGRPDIVLGAVRAADVVLIPVQPTVLDLSRLAPTIDLIVEAAGYMDSPPAVLAVLTRTRPRTRSRVEARAQLTAQGLEVAESEIPQREAIGLAAGVPVQDLGPFEPLLAEVLAVANRRDGEPQDRLAVAPSDRKEEPPLTARPHPEPPHA
ncbi:MAG TPA: ParA family protein [Candidatus Saccharimonadales bacterium]|nr:ParA family protein [Candidatus Saccharimonadales bacterium]